MEVYIKMKIALIQCPGWGRDCPPYTLALLSAWLRKNGHQSFLFDLNNFLYSSGPDKYKNFWDDKDLYSFWSDEYLLGEFLRDNQRMIDFQINKILDTEAKIIGFTVHFTSLLISLAIAKRIKEIAPEKIMVFGGPDCSQQLKGRDIIKEKAVDIVVTGEGEMPLLEIIRKIEDKGSIDFCPGAILKSDNKIIDCGEGDIVQDLDSTPFPDYSDFEEDILLGHYGQPERLEIFDSRGCVTCCHFCSEWQFWRRFRSMSGDRMYEEIAYQVKKFPGTNYFYFIGSLLNGDVKALSRFCDLVIQNELKIRWAGQAVVRPEMTPELLQKMRKAGCEWLGIGIESGSEKVVHSMNKKFLMRNAEDMLRYAHSAGINVQANFMFGIPTENKEDFQETMEFLKRNRENMDSVLASQSFCVIDKGTYLYTHARDLGIKNEDHHLYWETEGIDYPKRFNRYEQFCQLAISLGVPETSGVLRVKPDKWLLLGDYYLFKKDYYQALECYQKSVQYESSNGSVTEKIRFCEQELAKQELGLISFDSNIVLSQNLKTQDFQPDEKQRKIIDALRKLGLNVKADNFIHIEKQKFNRDEYVQGYPYWLTVDTSNFCTLKCPFCPTGQRRGSRTKGILSLDNFKRMMDELGPYLIHVDLCNWGEPLLNPDIFKMIQYAKQHRLDIKVDSNLNNLNEADVEDLILSGLDKLIVSLDGLTPETYSKYRVGGDFNKVMRNLKLLVAKKKELKRKHPYISWQFLVFRHNEHEIDDVKKIAGELGVDHVGITKAFIGNPEWIPFNDEYSNYKKEDIQGDITSKAFKKPNEHYCNWLWEAMAINPNGSVSPCCSVEDEKDDFGNIFEATFKDIWNNGRYLQARKCVKDKIANAEMNGNICFTCRHSGMINLDILSCHSLFQM